MQQDNNLDDPIRAFDDLRREVSLGLRAIQGLAAEHRDQPDYSDTLKAIDERLAGVGRTLATIAESPAMRLTPANLTQAIVKASQDARVADAEMLRTAGATSKELIHQLRLGIGQVRVAGEQRTAIYWAIAAGFTAGILLWAILPGALMRALPARWNAPEWIATRVMRTDELDGARRLLRAARDHGSIPKLGSSHGNPSPGGAKSAGTK